MFFSIGRGQSPDFPCHWRLGRLMISTDQGWQEVVQDRYHVVYKGYMDDSDLRSSVLAIAAGEKPSATGNFCAITWDRVDQQVIIRSDRYRGFPIYIHADQITNLHRSDRVGWTDSTIMIDEDLAVTELKTDVIGSVDAGPIDLDQAISIIHQRLLLKTRQFLAHNTLPIKAYLSGGVDSLLVYAYLQHCTQQFEMVRGNYIDYDWFWMMNSGTLKQHWGYQQIHHWQTPCVLTSGTPGDEFMLRSPRTVDIWLRYHGVSMLDLLQSQDWQRSLHAAYFQKPSNQAVFQDLVTLEFTSAEQMKWQLCNINVNDWQHWHIGHTLTWTPLRDLEIFKVFLRLPVEQTLGQIMDSEISRALIEMVAPGLSRVISDQKNTGNPLSNLARYYWP